MELAKIVKILEDIHGKEGLNNEQYAKLKNEVSIIHEEIYRKRIIDLLKPLDKIKLKAFFLLQEGNKRYSSIIK